MTPEQIEKLRAQFEAWIKAPPYERRAMRFPDTDAAWPGSYRQVDIDLAWQAWKECARIVAADTCASNADDLRAQGWAVAVHNDYRLNCEPHTFWLLTKGNRCIKGEGRTDAEALNALRAAAAKEPKS